MNEEEGVTHPTTGEMSEDLRRFVQAQVRLALREPEVRALLLDDLATALRISGGVSLALDPRRARQAARPLEYKGLPDWVERDSRTDGGGEEGGG